MEKKELIELNIGMCRTHPEAMDSIVDGYFFSYVEQFKNTQYQENTVLYNLYSVMIKKANGLDFYPSMFHVNLYVTGLTISLISALNVLKDLSIGVTCYHWDNEANEYFAQVVR